MSKSKKSAVKSNGSSKAEYGAEKSHDLPWSAKKVAILTAVRKLGEATSAKIAEKANLTPKDARHYCYHAVAGGLVKMESGFEGEGNKSHFSLTAAGAKLDFAAEFKKQEAAKAEKKAPKAKKESKGTKVVTASKGKVVKKPAKKTKKETSAEANAPVESAAQAS